MKPMSFVRWDGPWRLLTWMTTTPAGEFEREQWTRDFICEVPDCCDPESSLVGPAVGEWRPVVEP